MKGIFIKQILTTPVKNCAIIFCCEKHLKCLFLKRCDKIMRRIKPEKSDFANIKKKNFKFCKFSLQEFFFF